MAALDVKNVLNSIKIPALIKAIEKYPAIWNKSSPDYMKKHKQQPSWFAVCDKVIPDWKFIPVQMKLYFVGEMRKKWKNIKDYYRRNQRQKEGTSKSQYMYHHLLSFLSTIEVGEGDSKPEPIDKEDDDDDANGEVSGEDLSAYDCEYADVIPKEMSVSETQIPAAVAPSTSRLTKEVKSLKLPTFVHAIKKHPVIWNKGPADKSTATIFNERADAWNSIGEELIPLWDRKSKDDKAKYIIQIKKKWVNIRDYYRMNRINAGPEYKGAHSELLSFMKPLYTYVPNKTDKDDDDDDTDGEVPDEDLSAYDCEYADVIPEQISISEILTPAAVAPSQSRLTIDELFKSLKVPFFVHAVKKHPVIWNKRPADKPARGTLLNERTDAWNSIGKELIPNWEQKSKADKAKYINQMKKKWGNLRSYYRENTIDTFSKYKYSELLDFMKPLYTDNPNEINENDDDNDANGEVSDEDLSAYDCEYTDVIPEQDSGSGSHVTPTLAAVAPFSSQLTIGILLKSLKSLPLVRAIKKHPVIWKNPPANKPKPIVWDERAKAYNRICKELIPNWEGVSEYEKSRYIHHIKKKWGNLRTYYIKCMKKKPNEKSQEYRHSRLLSFMKPLFTDNPNEIDEEDDHANGEVSDEDLSAYDCEYADVIPEQDSGSGSHVTPTPAAVAITPTGMTVEILLRSLKMPKFVHAIKKHPAIWNKLPGDERRLAALNERTDAWNSVCKELIPNWEGVSEDEKSKYLFKMKKKWGSLRDYYRKHKNNLDKYENSELFSFMRPLYTDNPEKTVNGEVMDEDTAFETEYLEETDDTIEDQSLNSIKLEPQDPIETPFTSDVVEPVAKKFCAEMSEQGSFIEEPSSSSTSQAEDADLTFFRSFLPDIRMLDNDQKFDFKLGIMKLLKKIKNKHVVNDSDSE